MFHFPSSKHPSDWRGPVATVAAADRHAHTYAHRHTRAPVTLSFLPTYPTSFFLPHFPFHAAVSQLLVVAKKRKRKKIGKIPQRYPRPLAFVYLSFLMPFPSNHHKLCCVFQTPVAGRYVCRAIPGIECFIIGSWLLGPRRELRRKGRHLCQRCGSRGFQSTWNSCQQTSLVGSPISR